jgi:hypothetical protein
LELEQGQTNNAGDITIHFKQENEQCQGCFSSLYGCELHDFHELFQQRHEQLSLVYNVNLTQQ